MKQVIVGLVIALFAVVSVSVPTSALGLKIAPLSYEAELGKGEIKKGYVDVSNPSSTPVKVKLEAQAFRQIDDEGSLEFFDSEQVKQGVKLDFESITIGAREAYRVYFLLDSAKLASGDNFAAIFASTIPQPDSGSVQAVRVGTLLSIQNGAVDARQGSVESFVANWLQVGEGLSATTKVKNTADPQKATGFYPSIQTSTAPYGSRTVKGPLVFAGRTRTIEIQHPGSYFGPVLLGARVGDSSKASLVFAVTGYWRWLGPFLGIVIVVTVLGYRRYRTRR